MGPSPQGFETLGEHAARQRGDGRVAPAGARAWEPRTQPSRGAAVGWDPSRLPVTQDGETPTTY